MVGLWTPPAGGKLRASQAGLTPSSRSLPHVLPAVVLDFRAMPFALMSWQPGASGGPLASANARSRGLSPGMATSDGTRKHAKPCSPGLNTPVTPTVGAWARPAAAASASSSSTSI